MVTILRRITLALATLALALGANTLVVSPADAGGPGTFYVFGKTQRQCMINLANAVKLQRANGFVVTGENPCRKAGDNVRWFGDYVAN